MVTKLNSFSTILVALIASGAALRIIILLFHYMTAEDVDKANIKKRILNTLVFTIISLFAIGGSNTIEKVISSYYR